MNAVDRVIATQRKRDVEVDHLAGATARRCEPQAEAYVGQPAESSTVQGIISPDTPRVGEHGAADAHKAKRIPVGEVALFNGEQHLRISALIAKRIAAQAAVAPQLDRIVEIEGVSGRGAQRREKQAFL